MSTTTKIPADIQHRLDQLDALDTAVLSVTEAIAHIAEICEAPPELEASMRRDAEAADFLGIPDEMAIDDIRRQAHEHLGMREPYAIR